MFYMYPILFHINDVLAPMAVQNVNIACLEVTALNITWTQPIAMEPHVPPITEYHVCFSQSTTDSTGSDNCRCTSNTYLLYNLTEEDSYNIVVKVMNVVDVTESEVITVTTYSKCKLRYNANMHPTCTVSLYEE